MELDISKYKKSAGAFIVDRIVNKALMVSRKNDYTDFGICGGKLDPCESFADALVREVLEESGLIWKGSRPPDSVLLYSGLCMNEKKEADIYFCNAYLFYIDELEKIQEPEQGGGILAWKDFDFIMHNNNNCSFASYNRVVLSEYLKFISKNKNSL